MIKTITAQLFLFIALSLSAHAAQSAVFTNTASVTIVDEAPASSFPSIINVSGMSGGITALTVTLNGVTHSNYNDVSIVLLGPNGQSIMLQNGISSNNSTISNVTYTFADGSPNLPASNALANGTYKPTNYLAAEQFDAPAPPPPAPAAPGTYFLPGPTAGGTATFLSVFGGSIANGQWRLFIQDFAGGDDGVMAGGWSLNVTTSGSSLPIKLKTFTSNPNGCNVNLNWTLLSKDNVNTFEIQRGITGSDFLTIGQVEASNASLSYSYNDVDLADKHFQYRLKINDHDGKAYYSEVTTAIVNCKDESIKLYPNPVVANATLEFFSNSNDQLHVSMIDQLGRTIYNEQFLTEKGLYKINLRTEYLTKGIYFVVLTGSEGKIDTMRFTKE